MRGDNVCAFVVGFMLAVLLYCIFWLGSRNEVKWKIDTLHAPEEVKYAYRNAFKVYADGKIIYYIDVDSEPIEVVIKEKEEWLWTDDLIK